MEQMKRLPGRDTHLQQAAVKGGKEQHRGATQAESLEGSQPRGTAGGFAPATEGRNRKSHFFFHHRKVLRVELHDAKKRPLCVNLRHKTGFLC